MYTFSSKKNRKLGLDILRAIAILVVVYVHSGAMFPHDEIRFPWIPLPDGVALFFVLSGFLIGQIIYTDFIEKKQSLAQVKTFYIRRWFRTLPNYYLFLAVNFILAYLGLTHETIKGFSWKFLFFLQNFYHGFGGPFPESWSLSVEEWFYLFFPLILFLYFLFLPRKWAFLSTALTFIIFSFSLRILRQYWQAPLDEYWYHVEIIKTVVNRFDAIGWGILAAFIIKQFTIPLRWSRILFFISLTLFIYKLIYFHVPPTPFWNSVRFTIDPFMVIFMLPYLAQANFRTNIISRFFTWISKISYSLYLVNLSVVIALINKNWQVTPDNAYYVYVFYWASCLALSSIIYLYYEKPLTALRERYS